MNRSNPKRMIRSVRLFPRLATTKPASQVSSRGKLTAIRAAAAPDADAAATARAEVKARLLQMILDNEHVRRNGQRPNQV